MNAACPRCGGGFECGAQQGHCDCFEIVLSAELQAEIAARWRDCLCMRCLRELAQGMIATPCPASTASPPASSS